MSDLDALRSARPCVTVPIPAGPDGLEVLLPPLRRALAGTGPAIAPLPAQGPAGMRERLLRALRPEEPVPGSVAVVLATSGSTADPRGVLLPTSAIASAAAALDQSLDRAPGGHRWIAALPLHSAGGFMVAARAILAGVPPVPMSSLGGAQPFSIDDLAAATADAQRRSHVDGLPLAISVVPTMLARAMDAGKDAIDVLAAYHLVLVGGSPADPHLLAALRSAGVAVRASYGMTETCGGAVLDGVALPGVIVRADPGGRLRVRGRQVALGYRDGNEGWTTAPDGLREFRTGDLGRVEDALVQVSGRADDVVQVGGASVSLTAISALLRADPDVAAADVLALPDAVWGALVIAVIVPRPGYVDDAEAAPSAPLRHAGQRASAAPTSSRRNPPVELSSTAPRDLAPRLADRLRHAIVQALGRSAQPRRFVAIDALPLLPAGKPDRLAVLRMLAEPRDIRADLSGPSDHLEGRPAVGRSEHHPESPRDTALSSGPDPLGRIDP